MEGGHLRAAGCRQSGGVWKGGWVWAWGLCVYVRVWMGAWQVGEVERLVHVCVSTHVGGGQGGVLLGVLGCGVHVRELGRAEGHRGPPSQLLSERPRHHLCLPITRCAGSGQQTGAEVWLRRGHRSPAPYAGSRASGSPHALPHPHLLEGTAPPLGPWASLGVHSFTS